MKQKLNRVDFDIWYESEHNEECLVNYEGSSGGLKVQPIIKMLTIN